MTVTIELFNYKVIGSDNVINMLKNEITETTVINWFNFDENDTYFNDDGKGYVISVNHDNRTVTFHQN